MAHEVSPWLRHNCYVITTKSLCVENGTRQTQFLWRRIWSRTPSVQQTHYLRPWVTLITTITPDLKLCFTQVKQSSNFAQRLLLVILHQGQQTPQRESGQDQVTVTEFESIAGSVLLSEQMTLGKSISLCWLIVANTSLCVIDYSGMWWVDGKLNSLDFGK